MSVQVHSFGHFSSMQHSVKPYDYIRKMESLTNDMVLHIAVEVFTQFPHDSEEAYYMGIELSKRGLGGKIKELKKLK